MDDEDPPDFLGEEPQYDQEAEMLAPDAVRGHLDHAVKVQPATNKTEPKVAAGFKEQKQPKAQAAPDSGRRASRRHVLFHSCMHLLIRFCGFGTCCSTPGSLPSSQAGGCSDAMCNSECSAEFELHSLGRQTISCLDWLHKMSNGLRLNISEEFLGCALLGKQAMQAFAAFTSLLGVSVPASAFVNFGRWHAEQDCIQAASYNILHNK